MALPRISIVGAGIAGLVLGRCLLQRGLRAVLFEKSRPSSNRNSYGITLHADSYRPLLKLLDLEEKSFRNRVLVDTAAEDGHTAGVGTTIRVNRNRFETLLAEGLDIRWEHELKEFDTASGIGLNFTNGSSHEAEVLVGAEGPHSLIRQTISPETDFKILPFAVYNGKRRLSPEDFDMKIKPHLGNATILEQKVNDIVLQISISDIGKDEVSISYTYSRPGRDSGDALYRPSRPKSEAKETPDALFQEIEGIGHELQDPFQFVFDPETMKKDRMLNWLMRTLRVERDVLDQTSQSGVLLLGDAVHAEPILGGYGANEAIEDGLRLAEMLVEGGGQNLDKFYEHRFEIWEKGAVESERRIACMHDVAKANL
ncbi:hypothetical protein DOTSEDRAFT_21467 [Dothistroma septosporum NZE10]|uniref:FAD-binding domain-containing protein n=1 Tax=Dothistroma septosporum (strain NZE10 / CBS 128990) TaxID=675120 RepID=N1PZS2_DOTSN|nr:hypothetical protein DOTSEDRAFT_21467 [Dothistroma septosporum NZE10]